MHPILAQPLEWQDLEPGRLARKVTRQGLQAWAPVRGGGSGPPGPGKCWQGNIQPAHMCLSCQPRPPPFWLHSLTLRENTAQSLS